MQDVFSDLNSQITLKDSQNQMLNSEADENKGKLEDYNKEKRSLEAKQREFQTSLDDAELKRGQMEKKFESCKRRSN